MRVKEEAIRVTAAVRAMPPRRVAAQLTRTAATQLHRVEAATPGVRPQRATLDIRCVATAARLPMETLRIAAAVT